MYGRSGLEGIRRALKGREREWGMWPEERFGRGSGAEPVHLQSIRVRKV